MIKLTFKIQLIIFVCCILSVSCRQEEYKYVGTAPEQGLQINSNVTNLLARTTMQDGSIDNVLDNASCLSLKLPITTIVNESEIIVENKENFLLIEKLLDDLDDDIEENATAKLVFPVTIILSDYTEIDVFSQEELDEYAGTCGEENSYDNDIECVDIQYPITFSIFNNISETIQATPVTQDKELYTFLQGLTENEVVSINFPISLLTIDSKEIEVNSFIALEETLEAYKDTCYENDNNNFKDDSCEDCSIEKIQEFFSECPLWTVQKLKRNQENLKENYSDFTFNFLDTNIVIAFSEKETYYGTWSVSEAGSSFTFSIDFPGLEDFNATWVIYRIKELENNKKEIRSYIDNENSLRFRSDCEEIVEIEEKELSATLIETTWNINSYVANGEDFTSYYEDYIFNFKEDGNLEANRLSLIQGTWSLENDANETNLVIEFSALGVLKLMTNEWKVVSASETKIELLYISDVNGEISTLILTKE